MARQIGFWKKVGTYITPVFNGGVDLLVRGTNRYINFNSDTGSVGYGIRDNDGVIEFKNVDGEWTGIGTGTGGGIGGNVFNDIFIDQSGGTTDTHGTISGLIDGSNTIFTVSEATYATGTLKVWLNGQLLTQGSAEDWTESTPVSGTFEILTAPVLGDEITVEYQKVGINSETLVSTLNVDALAQAAVGAILTDSAEIDITYDAGVPSISASIIEASIAATKLDAGINASLGLADSATQPGDLAAVATSGAYIDLSGRPTLAAVATSGAYSDLSGTPDLSVYDNFEPFLNEADFPVTGLSDVIYLETSSGNMFRWTGSTYEIISAKLALGETSATAYRGDRGKVAYDYSQLGHLPLTGGTLTGDLLVPDEAYDDSAWNGSLEVPTKNAIRDKMNLDTTGVVVHGSVAATARPVGYAQVTWIGSIEPTNAINNDTWIETA